MFYFLAQQKVSYFINSQVSANEVVTFVALAVSVNTIHQKSSTTHWQIVDSILVSLLSCSFWTPTHSLRYLLPRVTWLQVAMFITKQSVSLALISDRSEVLWKMRFSKKNSFELAGLSIASLIHSCTSCERPSEDIRAFLVQYYRSVKSVCVRVVAPLCFTICCQVQRIGLRTRNAIPAPRVRL